MNDPKAHRQHSRKDDEEGFSAEYLAMLLVCGGTVRDSDRDVLPESIRRRLDQGTGHASGQLQLPIEVH